MLLAHKNIAAGFEIPRNLQTNAVTVPQETTLV